MAAVNRKKKDVDKPYITPHIKQLLRKKTSVAEKVLQTGHDIWKKDYKGIQIYVNKIITQAEFEYYHNKLGKERNQPRKLWGSLNEITGSSSCKTSIGQLKSENVIISDKVENYKTLNKFVSSIGEQLAQNFVNTDNPLEYLNERNDIRLEFTPVTY